MSDTILEVDDSKIPHPTGYRLLVKPLPPVKHTEAGIDLSATEGSQRILSQIGLVIKMGPLAYDVTGNRKKYGDSPWCKDGDWILYGKHSGIRFKTKDGNEWLLLNDDSVLAVVPDPRFIDRLNYGA